MTEVNHTSQVTTGNRDGRALR